MFRPLRSALFLAATLPVLGCDGSNAFQDLVSFNGPALEIASLEVVPVRGTLRIGEVLQLTVTQRDDAGDVVAGAPVIWSSSQPTVAAVNSQGLVSGLSTGTANITASGGNRTATATVSVTPIN